MSVFLLYMKYEINGHLLTLYFLVSVFVFIQAHVKVGEGVCLLVCPFNVFIICYNIPSIT